MNIENLHYFLTVAEELNFTKASRKLFVAQQTLSKQIQKLEEYYDAKLFNRTTPMTLTAAGLAAQKSAQEILAIHLRTINTINDIKGRTEKKIVLGIGPARAHSIIPAIMPTYHAMHPDIHIQLFEKSSTNLESALLEGKIDFSISYLPQNLDNIYSIKLYTTQFYTVIPDVLMKKHFGKKAGAILKSLKSNFNITLIHDLPVITMPLTYKIGGFIQNMYLLHELTPNVLMEISGVSLLLSLCCQNLGFSLVPREMIPSTFMKEHQNIHFFPVIHPGANYSITINFLKERSLEKYMHDFIELAKKKLSAEPDT